MACSECTFCEEIKTSADNLLDTVKGLIHEGNVRHIVIKNPEGNTFIEFPVNVGVLGLVLAPTLSAVGAIAVFATHFTLDVTRGGTPEASEQGPGKAGEPV
jgi:hypothetical protein